MRFLFRRVALCMLLAVIGLAGCDFTGDDVPVVDQQETARLYVANQGAATVSVIDTRTNALIETVDLTDYGFSDNAKPHHIAVEPDGSAWYVSLIGDDTVAKFSRTHDLLGTASIETPGMLAVHPTRDLLLAGRSMSAVDPPSSIGLIRRPDMRIEEVGVVFPRPHALVVDPNGAYVHTASLAENRLMTVNLDSEDVTFTQLDGATEVFVQFAAVPGRDELLVSGQLTQQMTVLDVSDPAAPSPVATIPVGRQPWHPVVTPDGARLYVGNKQDDTVSVIDVARREVVATITGMGLAEPHGSTVRPDGRYVYISNNNQDGSYAPQGDNPEAGTVVVIDTQTNQIAAVIEVGTNPTGVGVRQP